MLPEPPGGHRTFHYLLPFRCQGSILNRGFESSNPYPVAGRSFLRLFLLFCFFCFLLFAFCFLLFAFCCSSFFAFLSRLFFHTPLASCTASCSDRWLSNTAVRTPPQPTATATPLAPITSSTWLACARKPGDTTRRQTQASKQAHNQQQEHCLGLSPQRVVGRTFARRKDKAKIEN
jgi:hypothetical protein